ncbi:MBL fold metallo-hydrolase [Virgibacillus soli]|uniref:MBL fold metallo-hydrolase n=1 Tax=Paracerasibacillus soli TaxID=480284 RepID=A0ABU5CQ13_9BACI|nr:MBL fold metallo-hydrolase [Virgibacillus soli]MDY0408436.1 MBL fold metallo-hydrolase [Virgibacillus soli]
MEIQIQSFQLGPLGTNCYVISNQEGCLIVDPGGDPKEVMTYLESLDKKPNAILLTHAHFDHIGAVDYLRKYYQIDVYLHDKEKNWLSDGNLNRSLFYFNKPIITDEAEKTLQPGRYQIGTLSFDVLHTPGHSPGSTSFVFEDAKFVVSGDVLFQRGIGRTDLPGGDYSQLVESIQEKLYILQDDYIVYPGHGSSTTIGEEKRENPFVSAR